MPHAPLRLGPTHLLRMIQEICKERGTDQIDESTIYSEAWTRNLCSIDQAYVFIGKLRRSGDIRKNSMTSTYTLNGWLAARANALNHEKIHALN